MKTEPIEFTVDGLKLRGNLYLPETEPKKLAFLFLHGWTGKPNDLAAAMLAKNGFAAMTFSLSGHNNSEGTMEGQTRQKSLNEVVAAYDLFKSKLPQATEIAAVGNSYGGYMSILLSAERPVACLSLRVASNYVDEHFNEKQLGQGSEDPSVLKWRHEPLDFNATRTLRAIHAFKASIQIIEAELDDVVPHQTTQNYVDAISDKKQLEYHLMKSWPHSLGLDAKRNRQFQQMLLSWAQKQTKQI